MKQIVTLIIGLASSATVAFAQQAIPSVQPLQAAPTAGEYKYNAQDGYYYNPRTPENKMTVREAKTGFYISMGIAAAGNFNDGLYNANNSPGTAGVKDSTGEITYAPFAKAGYIIPGLLGDMPGGPNLAFEFDFSYFKQDVMNYQQYQNTTENFMFSPVALLSFNTLENRVRYWIGAGPTLDLQYLNAPSTINGLNVQADSSKLGIGLIAKVGVEYFFLPRWAVMSEYAFYWVPQTTYGYNIGATGGNLELENLFSNQLRFGVSYHF
ncbi:MAG: outer membrane beta-barrel protein [Verrucomicrobiota bacterium]|nr:outer membrane beta-barrel protein [Verrucomicrobiota bacterium]